MNGWLSVAIIVVAQIHGSMSAKPIVSGVFKRRAQRSCEFSGLLFSRSSSAYGRGPMAAGIDPVAHLPSAPATTGLCKLQAFRVPNFGPPVPLSFECHAA
jgi:hypothetical protein